MQAWYRDSADNALIIKSFQALSFVPPDRVTADFEELIGSLDDEIDELLSDFLSSTARIPQPPPKKKYQVINERLKDIVTEIDTYEKITTYLRAIAHNL